MWFYDEADQLEDWYAFRQQIQALESEHLQLRLALRDAEFARRADPENPALKHHVEECKKRLAELDRQAPWISSDVPTEILLWGVPHG